MKKILILLLIGLQFSLQAFGAIQELKSYVDLNTADWNSETLVVFDIDNTILRQNQMIGTHQWGDYLFERARRRGVVEEAAREIQYQAFAEVQPHLNVVPVEDQIFQILENLETRGISHFALTARSASLKSITHKQLQVVRHDFDKNFPPQKDKSLLDGVLEKGVIFATGTPKGELLKKIIENSKIRPKKIVFIDDRLYNLESVEKSFAQGNIILESYRYAAADPIVARFDSQLADIEYSFFKDSNLFLSDAEAKALVDAPDAMAELRFEQFLTEQGPLSERAGVCHVVTELIYRCPYLFDDEVLSSIDFEFKRDEWTQGLYFGRW